MTRVAVCIPVRDEAGGLPALLDGLAAQTEVRFDDVTLCLFFDGCTDGSEAIVAARAARYPMRIVAARSTDADPPSAGRARRAAMRVGLGCEPDALLTTDADSVPAADWIARTLAALTLADVVAGRIVRRPCRQAKRQDRLEAYYDRLHALRRRIDPVPWECATPHHFTGGANLGFRSSAYRALGGFVPLPSGEDARIVDDAGRAGLRVRRDPAPVVHTSSRRHGRAPNGLAATLRGIDGQGASVRVGHPADAAWQYALHAHARASFPILAHPPMLADLAAALSLTPDHVIGVARDCPNGEAFAMRIVPAPPGGVRSVPLDQAETALAVLEAPHLRVVA